MSSYTYLFKYIIIGDSGVGKSCVLLQFLEKKFKHDHDSTIGVEFGSKILPVNNRQIKLQVWDTAGQESFKSITRSYYRGSICCLLVYDVTNRDSFESLQKWKEEIKQSANEKITIMLIGNKTDLTQKRVVTFEEGKEYADKNNIYFMEASAKTAYNIDQSLGIKIGSQLTENKLEDKKDIKKQGCC
ncbi:P-loop containing nucleoside triphosphate hydrolase [Pseudocohnilembus persalinus]|uniref:p-loop containing nucleoside triphosphate hydrolase n=1 Tax=Pseudocohnilembus persalinus TaxID=266149 RepID=A0A0V0QJZ9_PSEPJ|nr:P-loop containing nucleoside triphosphate hydrolase [Pseudocohnilembus persalinus]|eukprot:KRX02412.1 P-loop containing nucleoside triphosphate hydrolase [Pseudocohnilembus persalinus]